MSSDRPLTLWQARNDHPSLITTRKTNKIGRLVRRIASFLGKYTKRKNVNIRYPHNSVVPRKYISPLSNVEKSSLFPVYVCCCLCWWKHSYLLESTWRDSFLRNEKWLPYSHQMDTTWSGVRSLCFLVSITWLLYLESCNKNSFFTVHPVGLYQQCRVHKPWYIKV